MMQEIEARIEHTLAQLVQAQQDLVNLVIDDFLIRREMRNGNGMARSAKKELEEIEAEIELAMVQRLQAQERMEKLSVALFEPDECPLRAHHYKWTKMIFGGECCEFCGTAWEDE